MVVNGKIFRFYTPKFFFKVSKIRGYINVVKPFKIRELIWVIGGNGSELGKRQKLPGKRCAISL